ncbi:zinc ribbon domain-containing protein [Nocardioides sp. SR21]|uniref:zinc ribbon domain-containing protein n=1 Tax=Nocardioides sp. SR21 TaxID=2919501 RepID=UPI001FAA7ECE|nr:zinc ribbon domain-containing protein [Nocardioides sp. SR21]
MNKRTPGQTLLLVVGTIVLLGGLVCVVAGFSGFIGSSDDLSGDSGNGSMMLFAAGGLSMVIGLGIVAFTRASIMTSNGGYARVTIEQGSAPRRGRFCSSCGASLTPTAQFCDSCGVAVG